MCVGKREKAAQVCEVEGSKVGSQLVEVEERDVQETVKP